MQKLETWIENNLGKEIFSPGLERISAKVLPLYIQLKNSGTRFVTIGGTNGKGQTAHTLAYLLREENISYTLWTSPHIVSITERFSSEKGDISEEELFSLCLKEEKSVHELSYFEFLFLIFMQWTSEKKPEIVILEVGLGGRLDAVNALSADLMAITSISRDHQEILGKNYAEIFREKWGITRAQKLVFTAFSLSYLRDMAQKWSDRDKVPWMDLVELGVIEGNETFFEQNQIMAMALFYSLLKRELSELRPHFVKRQFPPMPHRGDKMTFRGGDLQFIGSHNMDGMRKLIDYFHSRIDESFDYVLLSFSKRDEREIQSMAKSILCEKKLFKKVFLCRFSHPKAWTGDTKNLHQKIDEINWEDFLSKEDLAGKNILVTGSYYFVGEVKKFLLTQS